MTFRWTPTQMDRLERAIRESLRVAVITRRGTEYILTARRLGRVGNRDAFVGQLPMTGEELTVALDDVSEFQVIGD